MSINIDLGAWNSIFAVPSKVVDEGLKFSDGVKLKVLLFVLRNAGRSVDDTEISKATGVNVTDIPEALDYWVSMGVFNRIENTFTPVKNNEEFVPAPKTSVQTEQTPQPVQTVLQPQQTVPQPVQAVHAEHLVCKADGAGAFTLGLALGILNGVIDADVLQVERFFQNLIGVGTAGAVGFGGDNIAPPGGSLALHTPLGGVRIQTSSRNTRTSQMMTRLSVISVSASTQHSWQPTR